MANSVPTGKLLSGIDATKYMEAYYDRVVVIQDEYKSGRECTKCSGKGHLGVKCKYCKGTGFFKGNFDLGECPDCRVGSGPLSKSLGHVLCDLCSGQGTSSIIVPEDAEKLPTTGVITSVGWLCHFLKTETGYAPRHPDHIPKVGQRVAFTNFSGNMYELGSGHEKVTVRVLKEAEILVTLKAQPSQIKIVAEEFKDLTAAGISQD